MVMPILLVLYHGMATVPTSPGTVTRQRRTGALRTGQAEVHLGLREKHSPFISANLTHPLFLLPAANTFR